MRLRNWIAVLVSVLLLAGAGTIGILVNRSALEAADTVHRADTRALAVNNGALIGQLQRLAVGELQEFLAEQILHLGRDNAADRRALLSLSAESDTFGYGALITDLSGTVLTSSRATGLPAPTDPGWEPMRRLVAAGRAGFSSVMTVGGAHLQAIAVPIMVGGGPVGVLIGLNDIASTSLQKYVVTLRHFRGALNSWSDLRRQHKLAGGSHSLLALGRANILNIQSSSVGTTRLFTNSEVIGIGEILVQSYIVYGALVLSDIF